MIKTPLRGYQKEAVEKAKPLNGFLISLEQRVGKTIVALYLVDYRKPDQLFIICPKSAIPVWERQIKEHLEFDWNCSTTIITFESLLNGKIQFTRLFNKWMKEKVRSFIICDEAHRIKNPSSKQARLIRGLGKRANFRLALTGTSIADGPNDVWSLFEYMQPGILGANYTKFKELYCKMGGFKDKKIVGYINLDKFRKIYHKYTYRKTLVEAQRSEGVPVTLVHTVKVFYDLSSYTREKYEELENTLQTVVKRTRVVATIVLTLTMKLQQLAGGFLIKDIKIPNKRKKKRKVIQVGREKLKALQGVLARPELQKRQVVICFRFLHEIEAVRSLIESKYSYTIISGKTKNSWKGSVNDDIILLQIQSGIAIDLSTSSNYIFYSWDFSSINWEQSRFRIRSFSSRQVNYYYLIGRNTVDEYIYEAVVSKRNLSQLICDNYRKRENENE